MIDPGFGTGREAEELACCGGGRGPDDGAGDVDGACGGEELGEEVGCGGLDGFAADEELALEGGGVGDDVAVGFFDDGVVGEAGEDYAGLGYTFCERCSDSGCAWG